MTETPCQQTIAWLRMQLHAPAHWELVRHGTQPAAGRLVLVDRCHQRLLLRWAACETPPEPDRLWQDYRTLERSRHADCRFDPLAPDTGWAGFRRHAGGDTLTRAGRFAPELRRWIEMTLSWPDGHDEQLETAVLRAFSIRATDRIRAFGCDLTPPAGWTLAAAEIKPAQAELRFTCGRHEVRVRRLGMLEAWYDGDAPAFVRRQLGGVSADVGSALHRGHAVCHAESREAVARVRAFWQGRRSRHDYAWTCPVEGVLYHVAAWIPPDDNLAPTLPKAFDMRCCDQGSAAPARSVSPNRKPASTAAVAPATGDRLTYTDLRDSVPVPNRAVRAGREQQDGGQVLRIPLKRRWFMRPPLTWLLPLSRERVVALDAIGREVWQACDGQRTVEEIVEEFAARHRLSFHAARLSVLQFLQQLTRRGIVVMAGGAR
jgi:hypothetical protein